MTDIHTHIFSKNAKDDRNSYFDDSSFQLFYEKKSSRISDYPDIFNYIDENNLDYCSVLGFSWEDHERCLEHNKYISSLNDSRLISFASISSRPFDKIDDYVKDLKEMKFSGIGEISFYKDGFDKEQAEYVDEILYNAAEHELAVMLHVNEPVGHKYMGKYNTNFEKLYEVICKNPDSKIILSHWGGGIFVYELMNEVREAFKNVYYDTAASPFLYDAKIYKSAIDIIGADKILFGSDFPLLKVQRYLDEIENEDICEEEIEKIFGRNARRLFGLG